MILKKQPNQKNSINMGFNEIPAILSIYIPKHSLIQSINLVTLDGVVAYYKNFLVPVAFYLVHLEEIQNEFYCLQVKSQSEIFSKKFQIINQSIKIISL